jgi:hypothetical protein
VKAIVAGKATKTQKNYVRACAEADAGSKHNEPIRRPTTHRDRFVREFRTAHRDYELYVWTRSSEMDDKIRAETAAIQDKIEVFDTWKEDDYKPRSETEELLVCYARILDRPVPNSTSPEDDGSKEPSSGLDSEDIGRSVAKKVLNMEPITKERLLTQILEKTRKGWGQRQEQGVQADRRASCSVEAGY